MIICADCFKDINLKKRIGQFIEIYALDLECDFHVGSVGVEIEPISNLVDEVFRENYMIGCYDSMTDYYKGDDLDEILYDLTKTENDKIVSKIIELLIENDRWWPPDGEEAFYDDTAAYVRIPHDISAFSVVWDDFCQEILHQQRFFSEHAKSKLENIFKGVDAQSTSGGESPVYLISPGDNQSTIFRTRIANTSAIQKTIEENVFTQMTAPPANLRKAGRMNSSGIPALYGAFSIDTCISELRPSVGGKFFSVEIRVVEPICVLDMTKFSAPRAEASLFDENYLDKSSQWHFMMQFMAQISQPVFPDEEHLNYIPTQAVAEYLSSHHEFEINSQKFKVDAIIYSSAQNQNGKNIVVLGDAAVNIKGGDDDSEKLSSGPTRFKSSQKTIRKRLEILVDTLSLHNVTGSSFVHSPANLDSIA